jgi:Zn-dependent M28 family amino/carboxypeptidase
MKRPLFLVAAMLLVFAAAPATSAAVPGCDTRVNNTYKSLLECVTLDGARAHQAAFQAHADAHGGTRAAGTPGYDASVDYVVETLEEAGWDVELHEFPFMFTPPPVLRQLTPVAASYETGAFTGTGFGSVTAAVTAVDINLVPPRATTSGCEAADFAGFPAGNIALVQRGTCTFAAKALNAQAAGASAVIIFNQGDTLLREGLIVGTLGGPNVVPIPVVGASFADGAALSQPGSTAFVDVDPAESRPQVNVLAELPGVNDDNVVMAGAHLDSVQRGPGIQDNGSGSAALLEVAEALAKLRPQNTLRFAWWGAEESGLLGSNAYVAGLSQVEKDRIALYLNFDMIGSPNHVFFVYDGDDSDAVGAGPGPEGSAQIEKLFESYYRGVGISWKGTDFSGRSDYGAFIANGIPAGGLFTGAEGIKTAQEATIWGGTAGQQYDPCYHLACDTYANINLGAFDVNTDAVAFAVLTYAYSTESVNGVPGMIVPGSPSGSSGSTTAAGYPGGSQGGLHDDHDLAVE